MNKFEEFCEKIYQEYPNAKHQQRYGQFVFNTLHSLNSHLANEIRATNLDPFYWEDNTHPSEWLEFWKFIEERFLD